MAMRGKERAKRRRLRTRKRYLRRTISLLVLKTSRSRKTVESCWSMGSQYRRSTLLYLLRPSRWTWTSNHRRLHLLLRNPQLRPATFLQHFDPRSSTTLNNKKKHLVSPLSLQLRTPQPQHPASLNRNLVVGNTSSRPNTKSESPTTEG